MSSAVEIIAAHRQSGVTRFSHRGGLSYVDYPSCGCGLRMHPQDHAKHVGEKLGEAGLLAAGEQQ